MLTVSFILIKILINFAYGDPNFLLPKTSTPVHYDLSLDVKMGPVFNYNGTVTIEIKVTKPTKSLVLHSKNLKIDEKNSVVVKGSQNIRIKSIVKEDNFNFLTLNLEGEIKTGTAKVVIMFNGEYSKTTQGLYRTHYPNDKRVIRQILATELQPIYARQMFPCYDEPNLKATFNVTVIHPSDYHALSNAPIFSRSVAGPITTTRFHTTPKMSTYSLAMTVSDFTTTEAFTTETKTQLRMYTASFKVKETRFALKATTASINELQKLLKVKYPLTKLDGFVLLAKYGSLENYGLTIYGNSILLNATEGGKLGIGGNTYLIAHSSSHQWFGNLVTPDWWDYLWLSEGFATYYGQLITDKLQPSLKYMDEKIANMRIDMWYDTISKDPKSLNSVVKTPAEIASKFNFLSFTKAGAIVRFMRKVFVGFDEGITKYLTEKSYSSVKPDDLFSAISTSVKGSLPTGLTVQKIMKNWVDVGRFPLLTVKVGTNSITVSQEEFTIQGKPDPNKKWCIPLIFANEDPASYEVDPKNIKNWITDTQSSTEVKMKVGPGIVIANPKNIAFIRVNYDSEHWKKIIAFLKGPKYQNIHILNRIQLVDDACNLLKSKKLDPTMVLELLTYLKQEKDEVVHDVAANAFVTLYKLLEGTPSLPKFKKVVENIYGPEKAKKILFDYDINKIATGSVILTTSTSDTHHHHDPHAPHAIPEEHKKNHTDAHHHDHHGNNHNPHAHNHDAHAHNHGQHDHKHCPYVKAAERLFSQDDLQKVTKGVSGRKARSLESNKLEDELKHITEINMKMKEDFMKNSYAGVEKWLNAH